MYKKLQRTHSHYFLSTLLMNLFFSSFFFPICCQQPWFLHLSSLSLLVVRVSCQFLVSCHCIIIALCNLHFYSSPCFPGDEQGCYPACMHQGAPVCSSVVSLHFASWSPHETNCYRDSTSPWIMCLKEKIYNGAIVFSRLCCSDIFISVYSVLKYLFRVWLVHTNKSIPPPFITNS